MSPITRIALRRMKQNWRKNVFLMIAILFSMLMISFFLFFELQTRIIQNSAYNDLPFQQFMSNVRACMNITIACLLLITFLTIRIHCSMRNLENAQTLAILTSVGATSQQSRKLIWVDILILYILPTVLGAMLGIIPGIAMGNRFHGVRGIPASGYVQYAILAILVVAAGILFLILCNFLPGIQWKKRSVIQSVKKQNTKASQQRHSYRQSQTYKSQALLKRLAKKSIDYYGKNYNEIALSFALAALYPILAVLLFGYIGNTQVDLDTNQQSVLAEMLVRIEDIFIFLGGCFLGLSGMGIIQAVLMARMQFAERKKSAHLYLSIGMPESDIRKMIRLELQSVLLRSTIILIFGTYLMNAIFGMVAGG